MRIRRPQDSEICGMIAALIALILLLLLLWFGVMRSLRPDGGGVELNFGDVLSAQGLYEPAPAEALAETPPPPPEPAPVSSDEALQTQDLEESLEVRQARAEAQRRQEAERQARLAAERERQAQIRAEQERQEQLRREQEERARRIAQINQRTAGALSGAGGAGTSASSEGQGTGSGSGNAGNPLGGSGLGSGGTGGGSGGGTGSGVGSSYNLGNRKVIGAIPRPTDKTEVVGRIVVEIKVDAAGHVVSAVIGQGTNITESSARNAAIAAARKARFTAGDREEIGSITYNFLLQ